MVPGEFPAPTADRPRGDYASLRAGAEVGGDLYDFFWSDARRLCFVIADVSGKGAAAAIFMARTKTLIRLVATMLRDGGRRRTGTRGDHHQGERGAVS